MEPIGRLKGCEKAALPDMRLSFVWQMVYNMEVYEVVLDVHFVNTLPVDATLWWVASFPRKRESRGRAPWGLDARVRGHDVLVVMALVPDL